jgi:hypothetical protein
MNSMDNKINALSLLGTKSAGVSDSPFIYISCYFALGVSVTVRMN